MTDLPDSVAQRLNLLLSKANLAPLAPEQSHRFELYLSLLMRWNARVNLTAIRDEQGILTRHFVESILCARALPAGIATLLDFGSGAGFPGIPIAICRPEIAVTLAESQGKKAAFLRESVRVLELPASVHSARAETLATRFDCVTLRAVDGMEVAVRAATSLVHPEGWLALMTTVNEIEKLKVVSGAEFSWNERIFLPDSDDRLLAFGQRSRVQPCQHGS
jgi:16S rRNA (guanine527-N7)-methyltransferase